MIEQKRRQDDTERRRIKDMFSADGKDEFRRHRPDRGEDQNANAFRIERRHGIKEQDKDESGDVDRLAIGRRLVDTGKYPIGDPTYGEYENRRKGEGERIVRQHMEKREHK